MASLPTRYEHPRLLGPDPLGERWHAFDRTRGAAVEVVKAVPQPGKDPRAAGVALERAYWALAGCQHPALVPVWDLGVAGDGRPYFTHPAPAGPALAPPLQEADARAWLPDVVAALAALHAQGYVHAGLAPGALHRRPDGGVSLTPPAPLLQGVPATPHGLSAYLAPEAARREPLDARSDWHALGATLFHLFAGQPPYQAADPAAVLARQAEQGVPRLRQVLPTAPRALDEALLRLMALDPGTRPADGAGVLAAFGLAGALPPQHSLLVSPILGRAKELAAIDALIAAPASRGLWIGGPAGVGKRRLLHEALGRARLKGLETFLARGLGADAPPYEALLPWLRALAARAPEGGAAVAALAPVLPELASEVAPAAPTEAAQARIRLAGAVAELARAVAPNALWLLDDADRLDPASAALLSALRRVRGDQRWRWLFAGEAAQPVRPELGEVADERVELAPLAPADVVAIARAQLGHEGLPVALTERLPVLSAGLPARVGALLGHWIAEGDLVPEAGRWIAAPGAGFLPPPDYELAPDQAVQRLAPAARTIARAAATLGERVRQDWLRANVGVPDEDFFGALAALEGQGLMARDGAHVRFARPGHAAAIAASVPPADRARQRGQAARRISKTLDAQDPEAAGLALADLVALARLHLAGDEPAAGVPWALAAARRALAIHAPATAEALLADALALPGLAPADRLALGLLAADAWRNLGRAPEALALFEAELMPALRDAPPPDLARHVVTFGVLHQARGKYAEARTLWAEAIGLADAAGLAREAVRARVFAGRLAFFEGQGEQALRHFADAVAVARAGGARADLGWALALHGHMLGTLDPARLDEGLAHLAEAHAIQAAEGNHLRLFEASNDEGNVLMAVGRLQEARVAFERGLSYAAVVGPQEAIFAHLNLAAVALDLGDAAAAREGAADVTVLAQRITGKLPESFAAAVEGLALVRLGEPVLGWARIERALALAGEIGNRYAELAAGALAAEALFELGRWEAARAAVGRLRTVGAAAANHEHDGRFDRLEAALDVLAGAPTAGERVATLLDRARARGSKAELAHALRWQAQWLLATGQADAGTSALEAAEQQAVAAGLVHLPGELAFLQGDHLLAAGQPMFAGFALLRGLGVARKLGAVPLELRIAAALGEVDPSHAEAAAAAKARYQALVAGLPPAEREAYARIAGHRRLG